MAACSSSSQSTDVQVNKPPLIDLFRGWPNPALLPTALLLHETVATLSHPETRIPALLYGPDAGAPHVRKNIARWLTAYYKPREAIGPERIANTGGASQGLGCIMQVYTDPVYTRNIWCVVPCYMLAFRIMADAGFAHKLRSVPEDDEGIDIEFLREALQQSDRRSRASGETESMPMFKAPRPYGKFYRHLIYAVPTFSNPSSKVMSLRRREQLVSLAREFDALVVCDDVYDFLQWPTSSMATTSPSTALIPRVVDVDRFLDGGAERPGADAFGNVASSGSFSKIAAPGLRSGWVEGTPKFAFGASQAGTTHSGGAPSHTIANILSLLLERGKLNGFIFDVLQPSYARRYRIMRGAVQKYLLPLGSSLDQKDGEIAGGYFIWLTLPEGLTSMDVVARATTEENILVAAGPLFEVPGDNMQVGTKFENNLRLCFAWEDEDKLAEGVERLARVLWRMLDEMKKKKSEQSVVVGVAATHASNGLSKPRGSIFNVKLAQVS